MSSNNTTETTYCNWLEVLLREMLSNCPNETQIVLLFVQHINCKFIAQPSDKSVRFAVTSFPFCSTENVSGHVCPPNQFDLSTDSGHSKLFPNSKLLPIVIVLDVTPGPTAPISATKHSEKCWFS